MAVADCFASAVQRNECRKTEDGRDYRGDWKKKQESAQYIHISNLHMFM